MNTTVRNTAVRNTAVRQLSVSDRVTAELAKSLSAAAPGGYTLACAIVPVASGVYVVEMHGGTETKRIRLLDLTTSELMVRWANYCLANGVRPERAEPCVFLTGLRNPEAHGAEPGAKMPLIQLKLPSNVARSVIQRAAAWVFRDRNYRTAHPEDVHVFLPAALI